MNTSRREFVIKSGLAVAGTSLFSSQLFSLTKGKQLTGIQLYSIREDMKTDPLGSLEKVAAMGYEHVEHANYQDRKFYGYSATEFKKILKDLGMQMPSGHTVLDKKHWDSSAKDFTDEWKYLVEDAATVGQQFVISPWLDETLRQSQNDLKAYMDIFNQCGELCQKSGMKFGYHNHHFEFAEKLDGSTVFDLILQNTDPDLVVQQLDVGNMINGGAKAVDIINRYPGRFESMHVKDEIKSQGGPEEFESTVLGKGIIDVKEIIDLGRTKGGTIHFIIEQEAYQDKTAMASIQADLDQMKKWGY